jgi:hypothetical protein
MNTTCSLSRGLHRLATACFLSAPILLLAQLAVAQGNLTPPGPPAATMKTLDQLEARTPISSLPFTINASGSYYLTKNLNVTTGDAITITASQVTLELNGFTISSTANPAAGTGILLANNNADITILNGHIKGGVVNSGGTYSGSGFANGISSPAFSPRNVRIAGLSIIGCLNDGIRLFTGNSTVVESCTVQTVGAAGIVANTVSHSVAYDCGSSAIVAGNTADDCTGSSDLGPAIFSGGTVNNCYGVSLNDIGVSAISATNCFGQSSGPQPGVYVTTAINCYGFNSSNNGAGAGIRATTATNCYGYSNSSQGILASTVHNCYGQSVQNRGLSVEIAIGSYGISNGSSFGINATFIANACYGRSSTGTGIKSFIAIGCHGAFDGIFGIPVDCPNAYFML